jgi:integrase
MGPYPEISLAQAREKREEARKMVAGGVDPGANRKAQKTALGVRAANSFEVIAREWFAIRKPEWAEGHAKHIMSYFEKDVFPWLGSRPIAEIIPAEILGVIRRVEERGVIATAHRVVSVCSEVFQMKDRYTAYRPSFPAGGKSPSRYSPSHRSRSVCFPRQSGFNPADEQ